MSGENVDVVRRLVELWNASGWEGVAEEGLLHPAVEYHDDPRWPEARSAEGAAAIAERFVEVLDVLGADSKAEPEEFLDAGSEGVVLVFRFVGEARASGIHHDYRWAWRFRVNERQVDYIQAYLEPEQALKDAGLSAKSS